MPTQIFTTTYMPRPDRLSAEFYWLLGVLLLGILSLFVTMRMPAEVIDALALSPGL